MKFFAKNLSVITLLSLAVVFFGVSRADAQNSRKLTVESFLDWEYVLNPQISPDGAQIVYIRRWTDKVNDKFEMKSGL